MFDAAIGGALGVWVLAFVAGNLLGPIGLFRASTLWLLTACGIMWVWWARPRIAWQAPSSGQRLALLAFALIAPTILTLELASPIPANMDAFSPAAAAQRIVTFRRYLPFDNNPYGYYPPLGQTPGTELFYALLAFGGGTRFAILADTAAMLPFAALLVFGVYRLGKSIGGDELGGFAALVLLATVMFRVLPTGHGRFVTFVVVPTGLAFLLDRERDHIRLIVGALILATAVAAHAIIGTFAMATFAGVALAWLLAGDFAAAVAAVGLLAGATLVALPAVLVGLNHPIPYPALPAAQIFGIAVIVLAARRMPAREPREPRLLLVVAASVVAALLIRHPRALDMFFIQWESHRYPFLWMGGALGVLVALVLPGRQQRAPVMMLVGAGLLVEFVSMWGRRFSTGHLLLGFDDLRYKVDFWYPFALVFAAAWVPLLAARYLPKRIVVYVLLAVLAYPWRSAKHLDQNYNEHSITEEAAENMQLAKWGYWGATGHRRWAQTDAEMALIDILRDEIASGRITAATHIAHLRPFIYLYQDVVLFSVYTGINDDLYIANYAADPSIVGGRIRPIETFESVLRSSPPQYVVIHQATVNNVHLDDHLVTNLDLSDYDTLLDRDGVRLLRLKGGVAAL